MANIKFSQFTVGNTESDIDFVVGYKGANNIQISPTNLLAASLSGYLPLTGGTMTGGITMVDDVGILFGSGGDSFIKHTGTQMSMFNDVGHMYFVNRANDRNIYFQSDNGSGGTETYLFLDGNSSKTVLPDNKQIQIGSGSGDAYIYSDGTNMWIQGNNPSADIKLYQGGTDGSIRFYSDNGSGGVAEYFAVDGGEEQVRFFKDTEHADNVKATFGNSGDMEIYHDGSHSYVKQGGTGNLYIQQFRDDGDIIFQSDNGSGGMAEYFRLDGNLGYMVASKHILLDDNVKLRVGSSADLEIYHDGSNSNYITSTTSDIYLRNEGNNDRIFIQATNSGTVANYLIIDGGSGITKVARNFRANDNVALQVGVDGDAGMYHDGANTYIQNDTGDLYIRNNFQDRDIIFQSDDGGGGIATYFQLDGSRADLNYTYTTRPDGGVITFGGNLDLRIWRDPIVNKSYIRNYNDDFIIENVADDKDIIFNCDNGSGGVTEYFRVDGSSEKIIYSKNQWLFDNIRAVFGSSDDLQIYHNSSNDRGYIYNATGDLYIENDATDGDIKFFSDNGSGGTAQYFRVDGGITKTVFFRDTKHEDSVKGLFGTNDDLQIYHDGTNSFIDDAGTGILYVRAAANIYFQTYGSGKRWASFFENQGIELFYNDVKKLETRSTGIKISGVSEYADNTAAIAGGLTTGDVYRTGDLLKIVH